MTAVELGRVRPLCKCGAPEKCHRLAHGVCEHCDECDRYEPVQDWPPNVQRAMAGLSPDAKADMERVLRPRPVVAQLLNDVAAIIARRRQECYGSLAITDAQVDELSRAIVATLTATYRIEENT